jgi:hypothetical protein
VLRIKELLVKLGVLPAPADQLVMRSALDDPAYSNLWWGASGTQEAGVGNGIVDWRLANDQSQSAQGYERFLDTSAYFAEVLLMLYFGTDTSYMTQ